MNSFTNWVNEEKGVSFRDAIARDSMERLGPVLKMALGAGVGLIPMALDAGEPGREIRSISHEICP